MLTSQQITEARAKLGLPPVDGSQNIGSLTGESLFNTIAQSIPKDTNPEGNKSIFGEKPKTTLAQNVGKNTEGIANALTGSTQAFGKTIGETIAAPQAIDQFTKASQEHSDIELNIAKKISELKAIGQDTSKLEKALKDVQSSRPIVSDFTKAPEITNKQIIGQAIGTGLEALSGGLASGAEKTVASKTISTLGKVGEGAGIGAAYGGTQGLSSGLQENKDSAGIIESTALGAGVGALAGGATAGVAAKVPEIITGAKSLATKGKGIVSEASGKLSARNTAKQEEFVLDLVAPKATEKVKQQALKEGRVTEQGLLSASKILPSKRDIQVAETVKDIVSSKKSAGKNIEAISKTVSEINTGVKAYVAEHKVPFNGNQLKTKLNKGKDELKLIFASDKQAEKTYDAVVKEFIKHVKSKDTAGLLDARQAFDKIPSIRKLLESQGLGENVKKEIVLTARGKANEYIASLLPKGNKYRETLLKENKMIEAIGNIAEKNSKEIGKNKLQTLTEDYPVLKWLIGGLAGSAGIGVGGALIGSSD